MSQMYLQFVFFFFLNNFCELLQLDNTVNIFEQLRQYVVLFMYSDTPVLCLL